MRVVRSLAVRDIGLWRIRFSFGSGGKVRGWFEWGKYYFNFGRVKWN